MNRQSGNFKSPPAPGGRSSVARTIRFVLVIALVAFGLYMNSQRQRDAAGPAPLPEPPVATPLPREIAPEATPPAETARDETPAPATRTAPPANDVQTELQTKIPNVTLRDLDGDVVFRGTVDVTETLARIEAGQRLRFPNDGSTFQNRERRLPRQPSGYYKEYVHPTPQLSGPGPQRIVIGRQGETYYTADHYRTFHRLDPSP